MKEQITSYGAYNLWANQQIITAVNQLPAEKQQQEVISSFKTIHSTLLHMWNAESVWYQRMKLQERIVMPIDHFRGDTAELGQLLLQQSKLWSEWAAVASEAALDHVFQYYNSKKEYFKQPVWQVMMHVFNHGTYHRGQLVTMLRQLGMEKIPQTDFIIFTRKK
jgi:uncharacterized damage-inducible protein DinB